MRDRGRNRLRIVGIDDQRRAAFRRRPGKARQDQHTGVLGIYVAGFMHLLRPALAIVLPAIFLAIGAPPIVRCVRGWRAARAAGGAAVRIALGGLPLAATVVGLLLLGVLYLGALSPDAINYDASWQHLVIAQDYADRGTKP